MNQLQQNAIAHARNKVLGAENARQDQYASAATGYKDAAQQTLTRDAQEASRSNLADKRNSTIQGNISQDGSYDIPTAGSAPSVIKTQLAKRISDALAAGRDRGSALAKLGSWNDLNFENGVNLTNSGSNINQLGNFATGSAGVVPLELQGANNAGAGFGLAGDILGVGGQFGAAYGAQNPTSWNDIFGAKTQGPSYGPYGKAGLRPY
jgi:hypothetical protein